MKHLLKAIIISAVLSVGFVSVAQAQTVGPNFLRQQGGNLYPSIASTTLGTSSVNGAFNNLNVVGTCTGCGGGASTSSNNTFTGTNAFTGLLFFNMANGVHYFPSPAQLIAGVICGGNLDHEVGQCFNDLYASDEGVVSTTVVQFPAAQYPTSTDTSHMYCGSLGHKCQILGASGDGTTLRFGGGGGTSAIVLDFGPGPNASGTSIKQVATVAVEHLAIIGNNQTLGSGQIGIKMGINNGAGHTVIDDVNITGMDKGIVLGQNTYGSSVQNSLFSANAQNVLINSANNSGEDITFFNDWIVDPANGDATGGGNGCIDLEANATENFTMIGGSIDDCQMYVKSGNLSVSIHGTNDEDASHNTYGSYPYIIEGSGSHLSLETMQFMNDATSTAAGAPPEFVNALGNFDSNGVTFTTNGSAATTPNYVLMNTSTAVVTVSGNYNTSGNGITGLVNGSNPNATFFSQTQNGPAYQIISGNLHIGTTTVITGDGTVSTINTELDSGVLRAAQKVLITALAGLQSGNQTSTNTLLFSNGGLELNAGGSGSINLGLLIATSDNVYAAGSFNASGTISQNGVPVKTTATTATLTYTQTLDTTSTVVSVTNSASNATSTIYSYTVPANTLGTSGKAIRITMEGTYLNTSSTVHGVNLFLAYGSQTVASGSTANITTSTIPGYWNAIFYLSNASGSAQNQLGSFQSNFKVLGNTFNQFGSGGTGVDSTQSQAVQIWATGGVVNPSSTLTVNNVTTELIGATTTIVTAVN